MGWDKEVRVAEIITQVTVNENLQALIEKSKDLSNMSQRRLVRYIELLQEEEKENE